MLPLIHMSFIDHNYYYVIQGVYFVPTSPFERICTRSRVRFSRPRDVLSAWTRRNKTYLVDISRFRSIAERTLPLDSDGDRIFPLLRSHFCVSISPYHYIVRPYVYPCRHHPSASRFPSFLFIPWCLLSSVFILLLITLLSSASWRTHVNINHE